MSTEAIDKELYYCSVPFFEAFDINVFFPDGASWINHCCRLVAYIVFLCLNFWHQKSASRYVGGNFEHAQNVILPVILTWLYLNVGVNLFMTIVNAIFSGERKCGDQFFGAFIGFESGMVHALYEGLAIFLCRYGIGWKSLRSSLLWGTAWGVFSYFCYFIIVNTLCHGVPLPALDKETYENQENNYTRINAIIFTVAFLYNFVLASFYSFLYLAPIEWLYRRPAAYFYAGWNIAFHIFWLLVIVIFYGISGDDTISISDLNKCLCTFTALAILLIVFVQPVVFYHTLKIDSQYWQGFLVDEGNPTFDLWLLNDADTAQSMATGVGEFERTFHRSVPLLHFGMIQIDESKGFISGGFSRVYFGELKNAQQPIALKLIYAIELSSDEIRAYCEEASVLNELQHENIVQCKGMCVMPPVLALAFEYCQYGSLFDVLHKRLNRDEPNMRQSEISGSSMFGSIIERFSQSLRSSTHNDNDVSYGDGDRESSSSRHSRGSRSSRNSSFTQRVLSTSVLRSTGGVPTSSRGPITSMKNLMDIQPSMFSSKKKEESISVRAKVNSTSSSKPGDDTSNVADDIQPSTSGGTEGSRISLRLHDVNYTANKDENMQNAVTTTRASDNRWIMNEGEEGEEDEEEGVDDEEGGGVNSDGIRMSSLTMSTWAGNPSKMGASPSVAAASQDAAAIEAASIYDNSVEYKIPDSLGASLSLQKRYSMMYDCIAALNHIHKHGFMHCDIKSLNYLVCDNYRVKLSDLGDTKKINTIHMDDKPPMPSRIWAPPEVLCDQPAGDAYQPSSDVYSLAIVLAEIASIKIPYNDTCDKYTPDQWHKIVGKGHIRPELPHDLPTVLREAIQRAWDTDQNQRGDLEDLLQAVSSLTFQKQVNTPTKKVS